MAADIRYQLLGHTRACLGESELAVGPPQQQAVLVCLLLRAGRAVSVDGIVDSVWGPQAPDTAVAAVRTYAWRLRKALGEQQGEERAKASTVSSVGTGYQMTVGPDQLDVLRVERLAAEAARARDSGGIETARTLVMQALRLWHGEPLAKVPGPFAKQQRARLEALRLALMEECFDLDLLLGRHALAIPDLNAFVTEHPLRERGHGQLMRALYADGQQAAALDTFEQLRRRLGEELGVDPSHDLRSLHQRILRNDPALDAVQRAEAAPSAAADAPGAADRGHRPAVAPVPAQLPSSSADFTGRAEAVARLRDAIGSGCEAGMPVARISGMGGVGKTALALHVAHQLKPHFADGQLYADLGGSGPSPARPEAVLVSFLASLGVPENQVPDNLEDRAGLYRSLLDGRRVLILLDDVRDASQVRPLLPGSNGSAVLVTGRPRIFSLPTVAHVDLDVLIPDEALALLASVCGPDRVAAEPEAARALVSRCGLLPLAIRIVANRLASRPTWTIRMLADRLADQQARRSAMQIGDLDVHSCFELSYRQLTTREARAFLLVAAVGEPDISTSAAAAALAVDEHVAEELLESLVDAAMLSVVAPNRYRHHSLLRDFARTRIRATDCSGAQEAHDRLLAFLVSTAGAAATWATPADPLEYAWALDTVGGLRFTDADAARDWIASEADSAMAAVMAATRSTGPGHRARLRKAADLLIALNRFRCQIRYEQVAPTAEVVARVAAAAGDSRSAARARFVLTSDTALCVPMFEGA
ncbi:BTAD domain-containing putative transcriptional regulator [Streptomyces sp. NPDC020800]|uniref:AfsR/SARP family transcriptional regulator n=1 Tax=Streptomyces sp. NPDC020800 TaxID=3365092 RepID=UPI0037A153E4